MRTSIQVIPPPLPAKLGEQRVKPPQLVDEVTLAVKAMYDNYEDTEYNRFRRYINTTCAMDSVSGKREFDTAYAVQMIKEYAKHNNMPLIIAATEAEVARKLQFALRRFDTPETPISRSARLKALEDHSTRVVEDNNDNDPFN